MGETQHRFSYQTYNFIGYYIQFFLFFSVVQTNDICNRIKYCIFSVSVQGIFRLSETINLNFSDSRPTLVQPTRAIDHRSSKPGAVHTHKNCSTHSSIPKLGSNSAEEERTQLTSRWWTKYQRLSHVGPRQQLSTWPTSTP